MTTLIVSALLGISGSYFESRTCALYAGPCHFSGEVMVDGGTALLAWRFETGQFKGLSAAAVIHAEKNFAFDSPRKSIVILPTNASAAQRNALLRLIAARVDLGRVVRDLTGTVVTTDDSVIATSAGRQVFAATTSFRECRVCSMPGQLWYEPLTQGAQTRVATVEEQSLSNDSLGETWIRKDEPAAFVGTFSW